jgi:hypothetical protein
MRSPKFIHSRLAAGIPVLPLKKRRVNKELIGVAKIRYYVE